MTNNPRPMVALLAAMTLALTLLLLIDNSVPVQANPGVLYVAPDGDCGGTTPNCHASFQAAVDVANEGDEIRVAAGLYTDLHSRSAPPGYDDASTIDQVVYVVKSVTIRGGYATSDWSHSYPRARPTTLDARGQGRVIFVAANSAPVIEGLRITGGNPQGMGGSAGMDAGGGIYVFNTPATIRNNEITGNSGGWAGGGLYLHSSGATLDSNVISHNSANFGAGVYSSSSHAVLSNNLVSHNAAAWSCAGVHLGYHSDASLENNIISSNTANANTALCLSYHSNGILTNNVIADNHAAAGTSGLHVSGSSAHLLHTTIARNTGGAGTAVHIASDGSIRSTVLMSNTIIASHTVAVTITEGSTLLVNGILWHETPVTISHAATATVEIQNQHAGNPDFGTDGYHLRPASAAIDAGLDAGVYIDIDGDIRPQGAGFDLGADEFVPTPTLAINHAHGKPGSFFSLAASNFPHNATASVIINGTTLTHTLQVSDSGNVAFLLDTGQADPGRYFVTLISNPSATASFTLDPTAPLRPQEGSDPVIDVPSGIALTEFVYLPLIQR